MASSHLNLCMMPIAAFARGDELIFLASTTFACAYRATVSEPPEKR